MYNMVAMSTPAVLNVQDAALKLYVKLYLKAWRDNCFDTLQCLEVYTYCRMCLSYVYRTCYSRIFFQSGFDCFMNRRKFHCDIPQYTSSKINALP